MASVKKIVLIEFTPAQMFELVDRCEDYAQFLPWCGGADVHQRTAEITHATLHVTYHGIKTHFTTENEKEYPKLMRIRLKEGPFRHLDGTWRFVALGDKACKIEFELHYEFASRLLEKVLGPVFSHIANTFVDSFVKRAGTVYGGST
ncbi:MAG: type II toxin-antitoxin system RatA family toxin [Zoogloeaceae bacterium]|nr:type II toxin-antitoxin system RatA family toxin [Zoogloeaceae bacterium]